MHENQQRTFCASVQYRVVGLTNYYNDMDMELKFLFLNLSRKCTVKNLNLMLSNDELQNVFRITLKNLHTVEWKKTVCFLQDISKRRRILNVICKLKKKWSSSFTFDHINCSRYLKYQHVYFRNLQSKPSKAILDLDKRGIGGFFSDLPFTSLQGKS